MISDHLKENASSSVSTAVLGRQCVLLIDDDDDHRALFEALLTQAEIDVFGSASAKDALAFMKWRKFDLVVCDLRMPDMSGLDFVQMVRSSGKLSTKADVPIIMLTAGGDELEFAALDIGADMFCQKRMARDLLMSQIRLLLE